MVSTASTLAVLIALFLLGVKWTMDVIREWPRKKSISSHIAEQCSVQDSSSAKPMKKALFHPGSKSEVRRKSRIA
jgi:hypothetical protein